MSVKNFIPDDGSLWSIRAVDISGNYGQRLLFDTSGNAIVRTGNTDRLTIGNTGAWNVQGGMSYNNVSNTLTATTFSGALTGNATSATNLAGGAGGQIPYQSAASTTALLANGTAGQVLTSAGTTLAPTWTTISSGLVVSNTNLLYDDFMSCPLNNPITPIGLMGIQASTTSAFLSPYTGTKIPGYSGVIQLLNPLSVINTCWDIQNFQPFSFDNLPIGASTVPLGMTHKFFADLVYTPNVIQYIGVFSTLSSSIATMTSTVPNVFITVNFTSGVNGQLIYYVNGVNSGGFTVAMSTISSWYNFGIRRTASTTYQILGLFGTSGTYSNITAPMYLRCGSYTTSAIAQSARIYVDSCNVQLNTR